MTNCKSKESRGRNAIDPVLQKLGPIVYRPIGELKLYECNPRKHSDTQIAKLTASISQFGFVVPVLIDEDDILVTGEARVRAAELAGLTEIPVIRISHLSPAQIRAYRIADNKLATLATWDEKMLAVEIAELVQIDDFAVEIMGFETAEVDILLDGSVSSEDHDPADDIPEAPDRPVSRPGDLWLMENHRLFCGSCLDRENWVRLMQGNNARMMFVDPPYNVPVQGHVSGLGKAKHAEFAMASGEMSEDEFIAFLSDFLARSIEHLVDGAVLDICMDWRHLFELLTAVRANKLDILNLCVWNKNNGGMGSLYRSKHELVLITKKAGAAYINNVELGKHGRYRTNVWDFAGANSFSATRMDDLADHPTVKPVVLVAEAIRDVTRHGDIVIDPFLGSGTTILAAERTKRIGYGFEIAAQYVDVALRRWEAMAGRSAVLEETGETFAEVMERRAAIDDTDSLSPESEAA